MQGMRHSTHSSSLERHRRLLKEGLKQSHAGETDAEILKRHHRFIVSEEEYTEAPSSWEIRMAHKYYKRLFKEYALADLSRYRERKIGLRWRTEREVVSGKGQFVCGNVAKKKGKAACEETEGLHSFEVNFAYVECDVRKNELVKVRLCKRCAKKMNHGKEERCEGGGRRGSSSRGGRKKRAHDIEGSDEVSSGSKKKKRPWDEGSEQEGHRGDGEARAGQGLPPEVPSSSAWNGAAPKARTEEDDIDAYLESMFP